MLIREFAPAKINLTLKVRGRRPDGYHELESLIAFAVEAGDQLSLVPGEAAGLEVRGPFAPSITGRNLVATALERLRGAEPRLVLGRVVLDKRLPVASGIGGGSADAAALLRAVRRANPELAASIDWRAIAASLGADVTVCLVGQPALVWGTGTEVALLPALPRLEALLVNPLAQVPPDKTARVFARLAAGPSCAAEREPPALPSFADRDELLGYMRAVGNDLLAPAAEIVPEIAAVLAALNELSGCLIAGLSGAGPTCFGVFAGPQEAAAARGLLHQSRSDWWIVSSALGG